MNKPTNDIDLLFQSHFIDHEVALSNQDNLWQKIISGKRNRSKGLLLFLTLFLSMSVWFAYSQLNNSETSNTNYTLDQSTTEKPSTLIEASLTSFSASQPNNSNQPNYKPAASTTALKYGNENESSSIGDDSFDAKINPTASKKETFLIKISQDIIGLNPIDGDISSIHTPDEREGLLNNRNSESQHALISPIKALAPVISKSQINIKKISALSVSLLPSQLPFLPPIPKNGMMKKCEVGKNNFMPYIDIYGTIGAPIESTSLSAIAADQVQHLSNWEERFDPLSSISAGIAVGNEWSNGMGASVGFEYQRMESQYKATQTVTERTTIFDPMAFFFFDANDEIVWVGDSVTSVTTYDRTIAHANTTTLLNVPVHLSYNLTKEGPWEVKAVAGAILNLSLQYEGRYLQPDQSLLILDDSNQGSFVSSKLGIGIEAGLDFGYLIADKWEVYASPRYRFNNNSYWQENTAISLSRDYLGLRTGIRYHF